MGDYPYPKGSFVRIDKVSENDSPLILNFIRLKAEFDAKTSGSASVVTTTVEKIKQTLFGEKPFAYALLLKDEQKAIGFELYHIRYSSFSGSPSIWLDDLFINDSERSRGGGLQMINALTKEANEIGASHISWTASIANTRGQKFYNRIGAEVDRKDGKLFYYSLSI